MANGAKDHVPIGPLERWAIIVIGALCVGLFAVNCTLELQRIVPLAHNPRLFCLLNEAIIRGGMQALPIAVTIVALGLGVVVVVRMRVDSLEVTANQLKWLGALVAAAVAAGSWMQSATSGMFATTANVKALFDTAIVRDGRSVLFREDYANHSGTQSCTFCADMTSDRKLKEPAMPYDRERETPYNKILAATNAVDYVLALRESGAMSETDFQLLWAGIADDIVQNLSDVHLNVRLQKKIQDNLPAVYRAIQVHRDKQKDCEGCKRRIERGALGPAGNAGQ